MTWTFSFFSCSFWDHTEDAFGRWGVRGLRASVDLDRIKCSGCLLTQLVGPFGTRLGGRGCFKLKAVASEIGRFCALGGPCGVQASTRLQSPVLALPDHWKDHGRAIK